MKILRAIPVVLLACGAAGLAGCSGITLGKRPVPNKDGEVLEKLEAEKPANEKLPEIVSLPAPAPVPVFTPAPPPPPAPVVATTAFAASKPPATVKAAYDEPIPAPHPHAKPKAKGSTGKISGQAAPGVHAKTYTVQRGDTLQKISQKLYGTTKNWQKIFDANKSKLKKPDMIVVGMVLQIP
ncbi:MAG TPA: LysM peptidoglycan-binding domain-containing protein [Planctomycetota bacterium]|nr:LysM peptidoglycan-binding domain-containing protein [Planctomycetota bacterium]